MAKVFKDVVFPPEGLKQAEDARSSYIRSNWYDVRELIPGKMLWGLPIIEGWVERAAYTACLAKKGDLFNMNATLRMPSGLVIRAAMWHMNRAEGTGFRIQVGCDKDNIRELVSYFKDYAKDGDMTESGFENEKKGGIK